MGHLLLPQPLHPSLAPPTTQYALGFLTDAVTKRKNRPYLASLCQDDVGVPPSLRLRARGIEDSTSTESGLKPTEAEGRIYGQHALQRGSSSNPIWRCLFVVGLLGVLGALVPKLKKASDETIDCQLREAKEQQQNSINQLNSASGVITGLGQELKNAQRITEELKVQLERELAEAVEHPQVVLLSSSILSTERVLRKLEEKLDFIGVLEDKLKLRCARERKILHLMKGRHGPRWGDWLLRRIWSWIIWANELLKNTTK